MNSFRLKIALLSGLISGALLVGAGGLLWERTWETGLGQVDRELLSIGHSNLERRHGHTRYVELDQALNLLADAHAEYILHFDGFGRAFHTSTNWPTDLAIDSFAELVEYPAGIEVDPAHLEPAKPPKGSREGRTSLPLKIPRFETRSAGGRSWRIAIMGNPQQTLILGVDIGRIEAGLKRLRGAYLTVIPVALLLVGVGSWLIAGRAMRPVNELTASMENVTAQGLDQRVDGADHDREFGRLITVFNEMLDRLQKSFDQANRFSADASHELKTPLAIMQGEIEQALQRADAGSDFQRAFSRQLEEIQRLKSITQKLLLLSRADSGQLNLTRQTVNLSEMIAESAEDADILAPQLDVTAEIKPGIHVTADPVLIQQVLQNLTSNAVKYNHANGWVRMTLTQENERAVFRIANSGPGIAPEDRERVFDRFHRADDTRLRNTEGVGLGLSLCREIVRAHAGELKVSDSDAESATFVLTLKVSEAV